MEFDRDCKTLWNLEIFKYVETARLEKIEVPNIIQFNFWAVVLQSTSNLSLTPVLWDLFLYKRSFSTYLLGIELFCADKKKYNNQVER